MGKDGILTVEDPSPLEVELLRRLRINLLEENKHSTYFNNLSPNSRLSSKSLIGKKNNTNNHNSIFDLKRRLFRAYLKKCRLCGYRCNGQRILSGECPIGRPSYYHQHFIHVGEEKEIDRTLVIELVGCNIRCKFCHKGVLIKTQKG